MQAEFAELAWLLGLNNASDILERPIVKPANFKVHYECDFTDAKHALYPEVYTSEAKASYHAWTLLEERLWSVPEQVLDPAVPNKKGPKRKKRARPSSGPTS